jgi:hypothetical protein
MHPHTETLTVAQHLLIELAACDYLTASQAARLLEKESSLTYIREKFRSLSAAKLVLSLEGHAVTMPRVYTLTRKGREYASLLCGTATDKRFRPSEEQDKAHNPLFLQHPLAGSDVLIAARLLAKNTPSITLMRMFTERALRRKIFVELPDLTEDGTMQPRTISVEPDASLDFLIHKTWQNFLHVEVYRNLPPVEWRFKQKIAGYVTYAVTGQHEELFQTLPSPLQLLPHLSQWQQDSNSGLRKHYRRSTSLNTERYFSLPLSIRQRQAQKRCIFLLSGSRHLAIPKPRYLSGLTRHRRSGTIKPKNKDGRRALCCLEDRDCNQPPNRSN